MLSDTLQVGKHVEELVQWHRKQQGQFKQGRATGRIQLPRLRWQSSRRCPRGKAKLEMDKQLMKAENDKLSVSMESLQKSRGRDQQGIPHQTNATTGAAMSARQNPALQWELLMPGSSCWQLMLNTAHPG